MITLAADVHPAGAIGCACVDPMLGNRRDCRIHRPGRDRRDDGRIDDVEIVEPADAEVAVDDRAIIGPHLAGADWMVVRHGGIGQKGVDRRIGSNVRTGQDFTVPPDIERSCMADLAGQTQAVAKGTAIALVG